MVFGSHYTLSILVLLSFFFFFFAWLGLSTSECFFRRKLVWIGWGGDKCFSVILALCLAGLHVTGVRYLGASLMLREAVRLHMAIEWLSSFC